MFFMNVIPASDMLYKINDIIIFNTNITNALCKSAKDSCGGTVRMITVLTDGRNF